MSEQVGRAGFHVVHTHSASERGAILDEMMRELDEKSIARWAARNPSIVVEDEVLNEAWVNDGNGGYRRCKSTQEVLDYGAERLGRVRRKITEPRPVIDKQTGQPRVHTKGSLKGQVKMTGTTTTTMIVTHLPKSLCVELPDYYPVRHRHGKRAGQPKLDSLGRPVMRSRWVARDMDEAKKYFDDVRDIIEREMSPDGQRAVLGFDIQFSESTTHAQFLLDAFGEDPNHPDSLRADASRVWFSHRGRLTELHEKLKAELIDRGWDISPDFDEERHLYGGTKSEFEDTMDAKRDVDELAVSVRTRETTVRVQEKTLTALADDLRARELEVNARGAEAAQALSEARVEAARIKALAVADGRQEGRKEMEAAVAAALAVERELVAERARLQQLAAQRPPLPTVEQLLQRDPAPMASWMKKFTVKDGSTLYDMYEKAQRAEHAKRSDWKVGAAQIKDPYDEWLAKAEAVTVGDAGKQHQRRLEQISARAAEIGQPGREDEAQYGG